MISRSILRSAAPALLAGALLLLDGCVEERVVHAPPREVVVAHPVVEREVVREEIAPMPPPPRVVEVEPRPRPGYLWARGYWHWSGRQYVAVPGHWEAVRPGYRYVHPHWEHRRDGWHLRLGVWVSG
ncbi:YXWGXW repeat-containing protein [Frateuria defendens]|uniref:YXWGXW repeat-containing protein n=1 Tax=Frateuria defendens TaxID=2219559 RepID=UPI00066FBE2A|nr:YXWGXW repeat-containing protein [Frateuria defendens]